MLFPRSRDVLAAQKDKKAAPCVTTIRPLSLNLAFEAMILSGVFIVEKCLENVRGRRLRFGCGNTVV